MFVHTFRIIRQKYRRTKIFESHLSDYFCPFAPKLWEGGGDLQMIFYQSISTVWVVSTLIGGGDTQTLTLVIESELFVLRSGWDAFTPQRAT